MSSNDLIIDNGFAVLNDFKPGPGDDDDNDKSKLISSFLPRYPFASYADALSMPSDDLQASFTNDCSLVFTARTKEDSDGYSTGSTFFLPCQMKPRCALEALAQTIFRAHVDSLGENKFTNKDGESKLIYDPERSGAEWWTLVLDTSSVGESRNSKNEDEDEDEDDDEVGIHFDADYGLEEQLPNYTLHPRVATITYLSDIGIPTMVLDKRSPPPSDHEKTSLNGSINKAWLSHPCFGKHVAFDGRFLHGAPGEYFPSVNKIDVAEPKTKKPRVNKIGAHVLRGKRVTFLVNIWLNHCPLESEPLESELVEKLTTPWEDDTDKEKNTKNNLKLGDPFVQPFQWNVEKIDSPDILNTTVSLVVASEESGGPAGDEHAVICNRNVDIVFGASMTDFHNASTLAAEGNGSIAIDLEDGVIALVVGKEVSSDEDDDDK